MLRPLDVIWVDDEFIRPPGPKMVVCISPTAGLFVRINTRAHWPNSLPIARAEHPFLAHDSHIECGTVFELDDYVVDESLFRGRGVIGRIAARVVPALLAEVERAPTLSDRDKAAIRTALLEK